MQAAWGADMEDGRLRRRVGESEYSVEEKAAGIGGAGVAEVGERLCRELVAVEEVGVVEEVWRMS